MYSRSQSLRRRGQSIRFQHHVVRSGSSAFIASNPGCAGDDSEDADDQDVDDEEEDQEVWIPVIRPQRRSAASASPTAAASSAGEASKKQPRGSTNRRVHFKLNPVPDSDNSGGDTTADDNNEIVS